MLDKIVIVTGASGGLGTSASLYLLDKGYKVIGVDIGKSTIDHVNYSFYKVDLTKPSEINVFVDGLKQKGIKVYAIIHLAGIFKMQSVVEGSLDDFKAIMDVNFFIAFNLNQEIIPLMEKGSKIIICSSEIARYSPQPFMGYYAITKHTVDVYADVLRRECNYIGIDVVKVQCGSFKTKLLTAVNPEYERMKNQTKYFEAPLTKMRFLMDNELHKGNNPLILAKLLEKILNKKHPKIRYKLKNSKILSFLSFLPEKLQDKIYKHYIK